MRNKEQSVRFLIQRTSVQDVSAEVKHVWDALRIAARLSDHKTRQGF